MLDPTLYDRFSSMMDIKVVAIDNFVNAIKDPTGKTEYPESILRVQEITLELKCEFLNVILCDKEALRSAQTAPWHHLRHPLCCP